MLQSSGVHARRRPAGRRGVRLLGLVAAATAGVLQTGLSFVQTGHTNAAQARAAAPARRELLLGLGGVALAPALQGAAPAFAAAVPENLGVTGRTGKYQERINGRWTIVFGKKLNDKAVYKKDGQSLYLMFNDCGQFQMAETAKGSCDGFGISNKGTWEFDGAPDAAVKVKPVGKDEQTGEKIDIKSVITQETNKIAREADVNTFMGNMEKDEEARAQRLMDKFGAKIADGY
uniref:Uncharacterized protein n=1 Tax=Strombidinopsis acuminata TaxID=141414 RepID=A0A7S3T5Z0_9SPIT